MLDTHKLQTADLLGAPNVNFWKISVRKTIWHDLRSWIFETFVVKFLACLLPLGFSNIYIFNGFLPQKADASQKSLGC